MYRYADSSETHTTKVRAPLLVQFFLEDTEIEIFAPTSEVKNLKKTAEGIDRGRGMLPSVIAVPSKNAVGISANPMKSIHFTFSEPVFVSNFLAVLKKQGYTLISAK